MARLVLVTELEELPEGTQEVLDGAVRLLGIASHFARTITHVPEIAKWVIPMIAAVQREGSDARLDSRIKELAILRTSALNQCVY